MPIEKDEFNRGKKDDWVAKKVISFLKANKNKAFTANEIMQGMGYAVNIDSLIWGILGCWAFNRTLEGLVEDGRIITKKVNYVDYYMAK